MQKTKDVLERDDTFLFESAENALAFYNHLADILEDLNIDVAWEDEAEFDPSKGKTKAKIKAKHAFDRYTTLNVDLKFAVGKPLPTESQSDLVKVAIEYKAQLVTEVEENTEFRRTQLFKNLYEWFHQHIYSSAGIKEYNKYAEALMYKLINRVRGLYHTPEALKESG